CLPPLSLHDALPIYISSVFITEHVQPELDSYRFSKIATSFDNLDGNDTEGALLAKTHKTEETLDATNAYSQLKTGIGKVRKYGTDRKSTRLNSSHVS